MKPRTLWVLGLAAAVAGIGCMLYPNGGTECRIRVTDVYGKPVPGADVHWSGPAHSHLPGTKHSLGTADSDGRVSFRKPPGHPKINAWKGSLCGQIDAAALNGSHEAILILREPEVIAIVPGKTP